MKVILFDFDGVLTVDAYGSVSLIKYITDVTGIEYEKFNTAYRRYNRALLLGTITHEDIWDELCRELEENIDYSILTDSFINTKLDMKMLEVAKRLKQQGYRLGIITDNKKDRIDAIVKHNSLNDIFEHIFISADVGVSKKEDKIFKLAIKMFSVEAEECVFIDNTKDNLLAPSELGIRTIYYNDEERDISELLKGLEAYDVKCIGIKE